MPIIGTQQSPIQILTPKTFHVDFGANYLTFGYSTPLAGQFKKHNFVYVEAESHNNPASFEIKVGAESWYIRKIHIHAPSEHLLDSEDPEPFEAHLLHSRPGDPKAEREKLVVGVFVLRKKPKVAKQSIEALAKKLTASRNKTSGPSCEAVADLNPAEFLPDAGERGEWFRYEGSLTSHPFTEDVSWFVMKNHSAVPPVAFDSLVQCAHQEERPAFPLDRRYVLRSFA